MQGIPLLVAASMNALAMCVFSNAYCGTQEMKHTEGRTQRYEEVPQKLAQAVQLWHRDDPKLVFVLSLGDIIDGRETQVHSPCVHTLHTSSKGYKLAKLSIQMFRPRLMKTSNI